MGKNEETAIEITTAEKLREAYPELVEEIEASAAAVEITTADDLREACPELVGSIEVTAAKDVAEEIAAISVAAFKQKFQGLYERIVVSIAPQRKVLGKDGFLLDRDDPFAEGTLRDYNRLYGSDERLPIALGDKDRHTPSLLRMYHVRAAGCDTKRADAAKDALKRIAAGKGTPARAAAEVLDRINGKKG